MNQARFLGRAVDSVLSQENVDFEYVVVDAGSTDGSREYLATLHDPRLSLIFEPDRGPADGLNKGVRSTGGPVVGYLNADDAYLAGALRAAVENFDRQPDVDVVYGDGWIVDGEDRVLRHFEATPWGLQRYLHGGVDVFQPSTFFRRDAFERTAGFNVNNATCWDAELLVDLALAGARFRHTRADWSAFRLHRDGISGSGRLQARYLEDQGRIFRRLSGRDRGGLDAVLRTTVRCAKILRSPGYASRRLRSKPSAELRLARAHGGYIVRSGVGAV